jgi:hypothetical protein
LFWVEPSIAISLTSAAGEGVKSSIRDDAMSTAPGAMRRVISSFSIRVPDRNVPRGNSTMPPPALAHASMARWMAEVASVFPSDLAP